MHPTDRCHPNERTCTRTSRVPGSLERSRAREAPRALGPEGHDRGRGCFTAPATASAGLRATRDPARGCERACGRCLPTAPAETEPLTPLSLLLLRRAPVHLRAGSRHTSRCAGSSKRELPRSPGRSARERKPLFVTWGAFHRQGALHRTGGRASCEGPPSPRAGHRSRDARSAEWRSKPPWDVTDPAPWFHGAVRITAFVSPNTPLAHPFECLGRASS